MVDEELYQGIVVTQNPRKHRPFSESNVLANYYHSGDRDGFEVCVYMGFISRSSRSRDVEEKKFDILAFKWLDESIGWKEIKEKGNKMKALLGREFSP